MKRMEVMGKNKKSTVNQNTNDLTVYKVGAAFALLVLALLALGRILNVYATGSTFDVIYRASQTVWTLCVILCAACANRASGRCSRMSSCFRFWRG